MMTHMKITDWKFWAWLIGTVALILVVGFAFSGSASAATPSTTTCMGNVGPCGQGVPDTYSDLSETSAEDWRCPAIAGIATVGAVGATISTGGTGGAAATMGAWTAVTNGATCYVATR